MVSANEKESIKKYTIAAIIVLVVLGTLLFNLRHRLMSDEAVPTGDHIWKITISSQFLLKENAGLLFVGIPFESPHIKIVRQTVTHPSLTIKRVSRLEKSFQELVLDPQQLGSHELTAEYILHASDSNRWINKYRLPAPLNAKQRVTYLADSELLNLSDPVIANALDKIKLGIPDLASLPNEIFRFVSAKIVLNSQQTFTNASDALLKRRANSLGKAYTFIALCRASNVPARLITGVKIQENIGADLIYWVEVYQEGQWVPFDLEAGYTGELPSDHLALAVNRDSIAAFQESVDIETTIDLEQVPAYAGMIGSEKKSVVQLIDLTRLPMETQTLLATILLLPFGALITAWFRLIVGTRTFGTFTAALIALAMVYADWFTVTFLVVVVAIISFGGLFYVASTFSRVPRLVVVFTLVALSMAFGVSLMDFYNLNPSPSVVLLPTIVLTTLIDRVYTVTEEDGIKITIRRLLWTMVVALVCFWVFNLEWPKQLVILHPEIHLYTLALTLLLSMYKGKKLSDVPTFHWLGEPESKSKPKKSSRKKEPESMPDQKPSEQS